ncbi:MAG: flavodoxin family protein [Chloroflexi bacterium]|nr:flavodoxin family protein [Chloroflexota bacterium]
MKILIVNGSPRKNWSTAILLRKAQAGAASKGAETEFIHLYDLTFKGCKSCFACKKVGGKSYGKCATKDDLTPILDKLKDVDAIIMGAPIYLGTATGEMRSFQERLIFPFLVYDGAGTTLFPKKINTGCIYTMNMTEEMLKAGRHGLDRQMASTERFLRRMFGAAESMVSTDTLQFDDYSKVVAPMFDEAGKRQRRQEVFPIDCQKAFDMGARFATGFQPNPK